MHGSYKAQDRVAAAVAAADRRVQRETVRRQLSSAAARPSRQTAPEPFAAPSSLLAAARRVQRAAVWLSDCPAETLRVLQRRLLCSSEAAVVGFAGLPSCLRPHLARLPFAETLKALAEDGGLAAAQASTAESEADGEGEWEVPPQEAVAFVDFLTKCLAVDPTTTGGDGDILVESNVARKAARRRSRRPEKEDGAAAPAAALPSAKLSRLFVRPVLPARAVDGSSEQQQRVAAMLAAATFDVRSAESALTYTVEAAVDAMALATSPEAEEAVLQRVKAQEADLKAAAAPAHAALLVQLAHWTAFFTECFDPTRSGACDDGVTLTCAVLLACGMKGAAEADRRPAAAAERAVCAKRSEPAATAHDRTCPACNHFHRAEESACRRATFRETARAAADAAETPSHTRFFLGTAVVVLWAQAFLQLYRRPHGRDRHASRWGENAAGTSAAASRPDGEEPPTDAATALTPGEVFFIRDWLQQQSRQERNCLVQQAKGDASGNSSSRVHLAKTCASDSPIVETGFTPDRVDATVAALTEWAQQSIEQKYTLSATSLVKLLREMLPVSAYYATFFC